MKPQREVTLYARQPIFDVALNVFAYELLFRKFDDEYADIQDGDEATANVLFNAYLEFPFDDLLEKRKGFVNFTRNLLRTIPPICKSQIVIEILEDIEIDDELIVDVKRLKDAGYTIALDDYVYNEKHNKLLDLADIIKIDVLAQDSSSIINNVKQLKKYNSELLAEKVETKVEFEKYKDLGFSLFQGYFFAKPEIVKGRKIGSSQRSSMRLLQILQDSNSGFGEIEKAITTDQCVTYKLLRLINSSAFNFVNNIDSIHKSITLLGLDKIRVWGSLLALSEMPGKPKMLAVNALIRAQMCKLLAEKFAISEMRGDGLFTVGLLSTMDAFLDLPMKKVLETLNLQQWLNDVLIRRSGNMGLILDTSIYFERAEFDSVEWDRLIEFNVDKEDVQTTYHDSVMWSSEIMEEFRD